MSPCFRAKFFLSLSFVVFFCAFLTPCPEARTDQSSEEGGAAWVQSVFQTGKNHYYGGDYQSALREWDKLSAHLERPENAQIKRMVLFFKARISAGKQAPELQEAPGQAAVDRAVKEGDELFRSGKMLEAIQKWESIEPDLDGAQRGKLEEIRTAYQRLESVRREPPAPAASPVTARIIPPKALTRVLTDADQQLRREIDAESARQRKAPKEDPLERERIDSLYKKSKRLYDRGWYREAVAVWREMLSGLRDGERLRPLLDSIESNLRTLEALRLKAESARASAPAAPDRFARLLAAADDRLKGQTRKTPA